MRMLRACLPHALALAAVIAAPARANVIVPESEPMALVAGEGDVCSALGMDDGGCTVLATAKVFRLGRASVVESLGDGMTSFVLVVDTLEGRWSTTVLTTTSTDCGMHHCTESTVTRGPTLRAVTIGGKPAVLVEAQEMTTSTATDPDTGRSRSSHSSTATFFACTRAAGRDPAWTCLRGATDADHCTLTITGAGKVRTGCSAELTFEEPGD